jgi:hypothetical protein
MEVGEAAIGPPSDIVYPTGVRENSPGIVEENLIATPAFLFQSNTTRPRTRTVRRRPRVSCPAKSAGTRRAAIITVSPAARVAK